MYRRKDNPLLAQILMNRTLAKMFSTLPKLGKVSHKLEEKWNITEISQFDSVWGKKHSQMKLFGTFFKYFSYFSYVSHKNSMSELFSLLLPLGRCLYKTFPRYSFITIKTFSSLNQGSSGRMSSGTHYL